MPSCPICGCPIQRTPDGQLIDGYDEHLELVHGGECGPVLADWRDTFMDLYVRV